MPLEALHVDADDLLEASLVRYISRWDRWRRWEYGERFRFLRAWQLGFQLGATRRPSTNHRAVPLHEPGLGVSGEFSLGIVRCPPWTGVGHRFFRQRDTSCLRILARAGVGRKASIP